eukprot:7361108-Pyramimonas_sp.AAC.1
MMRRIGSPCTSPREFAEFGQRKFGQLSLRTPSRPRVCSFPSLSLLALLRSLWLRRGARGSALCYLDEKR